VVEEVGRPWMALEAVEEGPKRKALVVEEVEAHIQPMKLAEVEEGAEVCMHCLALEAEVSLACCSVVEEVAPANFVTEAEEVPGLRRRVLGLLEGA
jgi:hypothetical protein